MFSVTNVHLDHLKFRVVCTAGRRHVSRSECNVVSNECNEPTSRPAQPTGTHDGEAMYLGCVCPRGELGLPNCDDICMCVVNEQPVPAHDSVHVDLQHDETSPTPTAGSVSPCCGRSLSVRETAAAPHMDAAAAVTVMRALPFVLHV